MKSTAAAVLLGMGLVACGGGDDPITRPTPTPQTYVSVGGNYAGTVSVKFPSLGRTFSCPATTTANQSQDYVIFSLLVLGGSCGGRTITLYPLVIDTTGKVPSYPQKVAVPSTCGEYTLTIDGGFSGNQLQLSYTWTVTSGTCLGEVDTIQLTKQ